MKLFTGGLICYLVKYFVDMFENRIEKNVDTRIEQAKAETRNEAQKIVTAGTISAVEQVTKAVNDSVESATKDAEARAHGYSSYSEWMRMADAK